MLLLLRMAWRNVWRNKRRTFLTLASLSLGTGALVFTHAYAESMYSTVIDMATGGFLGHLQVHGDGYTDEPDLYKRVPDPAAIEAALSEQLPGAASVRRVTAFGLAAGGQRSTGAAILGIQPSGERQHTQLVKVKEGRHLADTAAHEAVVGEALAKRLKMTLGAELLLLGQAADGSTANDLYTVVGFAGGGASTELGDNAVYLHLEDAQELFALGPGVHQVVINLPDDSDWTPEEAAALLRADGPAAAAELEVMSWNEMMPELEIGIEADRQGTFAMDFIVFLIVVLGIFNTMTMATFERIRELGILRSIGMSALRMVTLILSEALILGMLGLAGGILIGVGAIYGIGSIELAAFDAVDFMGVGLPSALVLSVDPLAIWMPGFTVVLTCLCGGLLPALKAARLRPANAVRHV